MIYFIKFVFVLVIFSGCGGGVGTRVVRNSVGSNHVDSTPRGSSLELDDELGEKVFADFRQRIFDDEDLAALISDINESKLINIDQKNDLMGRIEHKSVQAAWKLEDEIDKEIKNGGVKDVERRRQQVNDIPNIDRFAGGREWKDKMLKRLTK